MGARNEGRRYQLALIQIAEMDREISSQNRILKIAFPTPDPTLHYSVSE
jgi:hypothetical protein